MNDFKNKSNNIINIIASIFFIGITSIFPMFLSGSKYSNMTFQKSLFFWILTAVSVFLFLILLVFIKKNIRLTFFTFSEWAILAFLLFALISAIAASFNNSIFSEFNIGVKYVKDVVWLGMPGRYEGFISFLCYALTFFITARFYKPKSSHFLVFAASSSLLSLNGILQFLGFDIFNLFPFHYKSLSDSAGNQLYGPLSAFFRTTLGNINIVSAYCTFTVVLFAALFAVSNEKSSKKFIYIAASSLSFLLCLITGDGGDAGRLAIAGAMVLLIPYWISDRLKLGKILIILSLWCIIYSGYNSYLLSLKNNFNNMPLYDQNFLKNYTPGNTVLFITLSIILLSAGLCLLLLLKKYPGKLMKKAGIIFIPSAIITALLFIEIAGSRLSETSIIWQAREILHGRFGDKFGSGRGWIWKNGFSVLFKHPVFGTGPDTFFYALGDKLQSESININGEAFDKAHNIFLQIAVCMGIPALLSYAAFISCIFFSAIKKAFDNPVLLAFFSAALSYMIQSFFCVEVPITTPLVWAALGIISGETRR